VLRLTGCLDTLPTFQRRVLVLRTGIGDTNPASRRQVARRLGANVKTVGRAETRGLRSLRRTSGDGGCGEPVSTVNWTEFPSFMPLAFAAPMPALTGLASLPSGDPADPNFDPSAGDAGSVLSFNESSDSGEGYSGLDSGLQSDDGAGAVESVKRTAAATSEGGDFLPLPVILMLLLLLSAGAAYAILGRTRRRSAGVPDGGPAGIPDAGGPDANMAAATAAPPTAASPVVPAPKSVEEPEAVEEPEPEVEDEPAPWLGDDAFADEPAAEEPATDEPAAEVDHPEPAASAEQAPSPAAAAPPVVGRRRQGGLVGRVSSSETLRRARESRRRDR